MRIWTILGGARPVDGAMGHADHKPLRLEVNDGRTDDPPHVPRLQTRTDMSLRIAHTVLAALLVAGASPARSQEFSIPDSLPPGVTSDMVLRGQAVFGGAGGCSNCHGPMAQGLLGPNLTDPQWWHAKASYLSIVQRVLSGVGPEESATGVVMPPRGGAAITDADVQAAAAYVWTLSHSTAGDSLPQGVTPGMVLRGEIIFKSDGNCSVCHGDDAQGVLGPNLTDDEWLHAKVSYLSILQTILTGIDSETSRSGIVMEPRGGSQISDSDVHAVAAFVWALSR